MQDLQAFKRSLIDENFSSAIEQFRAITSENSKLNESQLNLIKEIIQNFKLIENPVFRKTILNLFYEKNLYQELYILLDRVDKFKEKDEVILYLVSLKELGQIGKLKDKVSYFLEWSLTKKYYPIAEAIIKNFEKICGKQIFFRVAQYYLYTETQNNIELANILSNIFTNLLHDRDADAIVAKRVLKILARNTNRSGKVYKHQKFIEMHLGLELAKRISIREKIEILLLAETKEELMLLFEYMSNETREEIIKLLSEKYKISQKDVPLGLKSLRERLSRRVSIAHAKIDEVLKTDDLEEEVVEVTKESYENAKQDEYKYVITEEEQRLVSRLEYEVYSERELRDIIIAFIAINYLHLAMNLVSRLQSEIEVHYFSIEILLKQGKYADCIYLCNQVLGQDDFDDIHPTVEKVKKKAQARLSRRFKSVLQSKVE